MSSSSNLTNSFSRLAVSKLAPYRYPPRPPQFQGRTQYLGYLVSMEYLTGLALQSDSDVLSCASSWFERRGVRVHIHHVLPPPTASPPPPTASPSGQLYVVKPARESTAQFESLAAHFPGQSLQWLNGYYHPDNHPIAADLSCFKLVK